MQEVNPDLLNTFGHIDPLSTDGTFGNQDMVSSSVIGNLGTSRQFIVPSSSGTVGDEGPSTLPSTNVHHQEEEESTPSAGVGRRDSTKGNLDEEQGESHIAGGHPSLKRRRESGDHDESPAAKRLWNFQAYHDRSAQQTPSSEPSLSNDEFAAAVVLPYDPLWIDRYGLDRSNLAIPTGNFKFEKLFMDNVFLTGDIFVIDDFAEGVQHNLHHTALVSSFLGSSSQTSTHIPSKVIHVSKASNWWPDLQIKSRTGYRVLPRCKGTQDLIRGIVDEDTRVPASRNGAWKHISLYRNGTHLGSLAKIRDEYQLWIAKVDEWAASHNQRRRARREGRESGLVWQDSGFHRMLEDGSTEPVDTQYQLNPVYQYHVRSLPSSSNS